VVRAKATDSVLTGRPAGKGTIRSRKSLGARRLRASSRPGIPPFITPPCGKPGWVRQVDSPRAFNVAEMTDEEIHEMAEQINNVWFPDASDDRLHGISDDLIDPFGGPDEPDPDLTIPREEDGA
jgi:hypothetical protein